MFCCVDDCFFQFVECVDQFVFFGLGVVLYVIMGYFIDGFDWFVVGFGDFVGEVGVVFVDY